MSPPVKARSGHILLDPKRSYRDLVRVYPDIHRRIVEMNRPFVKETDPLLPQVLLDENLRDLKGGRKPVGYNRPDPFGLRLIFPIIDDRRAEFYFAKPSRCQEVVQITEHVSQLLRRRGIRHSVEYRPVAARARPGRAGDAAARDCDRIHHGVSCGAPRRYGARRNGQSDPDAGVGGVPSAVARPSRWSRFNDSRAFSSAAG